MTREARIIVIGGGVVGLGVATSLVRQMPNVEVTVLESEQQLARHGSGRNSGVLHAGFYYSPDSLKAKLTRIGNEMLRQMCHDEGLALRECGKVVVTRDEHDLSRLHELHSRGVANGVDVRLIDEKELSDIEPHARTHEAAIWSPNTAVADPVEVTHAMARVFQRMGGRLERGVRVTRIEGPTVHLASGERRSVDHVVNAAGLYADKLAHSAGVGADYEVLPFKGLYLYGGPGAPGIRRHVYPVPDPRNPFLGVHLTVTVDGRAKIGPTAIPALSRMNYTKFGGIRPGEFASIAGLLPRFLTSKHHDGFGLIRSEVPKYLRRVLVRQAAELVPAVRSTDFLEWGKSGIRAQLFNRRLKRLEMDFVVEAAEHQTHVLNAVSPAWTGSLSFGEHVASSVVWRM